MNMSEANSELKNLKFHDLRASLTHVRELGEKAAAAVTEYQVAYFELTGIKANQPVNGLDIVELLLRHVESKEL